MKGLIIKDFRLMKAHKNFFIALVFAFVALGVTTKDFSLVLGYMTMVVPLFAISTVSYDEFDNGYPFLFTLPISRTLYAVEKYMFTLILGGITMTLATLAVLAVCATDGTIPVGEALMSSVITSLVMIAVTSVMFPLQFKFGADKGRIGLVAVAVIGAVIGVVLMGILDKAGIDLEAVYNRFFALKPIIIVGIFAVVTMLFLGISMAISIHIMKKKEF